MKITFSRDGVLQSMTGRNGVEWAAGVAREGLFLLRLRDFIGNKWDVRPANFTAVEAVPEKDGWKILYDGCRMMAGLQVQVSVMLDGDSSFWRIRTVIPTEDYHLEWVDFPRVAIRHHDGDEYLLPFAEGCLLKDLPRRQKNAAFKPVYAEYPMSGCSAFYPGPVAAQFMTVCGGGGESLYISCLDGAHYPKSVDLSATQEGNAVPMLQHFTGGETAIAYPVELSLLPFANWEDAAERYRKWMEENDPCLPPKLSSDCPTLLEKSPVLVIYPVRGHGLDNREMEFNEYYPYDKVLPVLEHYRRKWKNPLMALLMHWEGTAPWAPPYVWPPQGGVKALEEFAGRLHADGNLLGLYASGIGWTQKSMTDRSFTLEKRFEEENVRDEICIGPHGEAWSRCCNGYWSQRLGFDLCPGRKFTEKTVAGEVASAAAAGVDYLQYFDQVQGGASPLCYSAKHGHPGLPGRWQTDAMRTLYASAGQAAAGHTVIGCENAAAQPYMQWCRLNDLRNQLAWGTTGRPVPLYEYLFHEYCSGFRGNGVCLSQWIDMAATPFYPLWSLAWHFAAGNLLSIVLKDGGKMHWHWELPWSVPEPQQETMATLIGNLCELRRQKARFLIAGRMVRTPAVQCGSRRIATVQWGCWEVPAVIVTAWQDEDGTRKLVMVNYNETAEECIVEGRRYVVPPLAALCEEFIDSI